MKIISKEDKIATLSGEHEIELSLIDSGIVFTEIDDSIAIIIKDTAEMIASLSELKSVNLKFTYIDRPEFPAVNSELRLKTAKDLSVKYDYFINSESEYEMNLLDCILNQKVISLFLFSDIVIKHYGMEFEEDESSQLSGILNEVNS